MRYHYVVTIQYPSSSGTASLTVAGTYDAKPGTTRTRAFAALLDYAREQAGVSESTCVLFWSLEPDDLDGGS